jgi:hypothetical protein
VQPLSIFTAEVEELRLRSVPLITKRNDNWNDINTISFDSAKEEYKNLWHTEGYKKFLYHFKDVLQVSKEPKRLANWIPLEYQQQSLLLMVTGLHLSVFKNIDECLDYFAEYWRWILNQSNNSGDDLMTLVQNYLESHIKTCFSYYSQRDRYALHKENYKSFNDLPLDECTIEVQSMVRDLKQYRPLAKITQHELETKVYPFLNSKGWHLNTSRDGKLEFIFVKS